MAEDEAEERPTKKPRWQEEPLADVVRETEGVTELKRTEEASVDRQQPPDVRLTRPNANVEAELADFEVLQERENAQWCKEKLPPPREHELEFLIKDLKSYRQGKSVLSEITSLQGSFRFRLLVFPMGTESTGKPEQLAAFVEVVPPDGYQEVRWAFEGVKYQISVVNWKDYRRTMTQNDTFTFQKDSSDRGWHRGFLKATDMNIESGWLNEQGELCLRAACSVRRAMLHISNGLVGGSRRSVGFVGLKNHGATCYMNCLLQTHFHTGQFRHIVYSIDNKDTAEQAAVSGDDLDGDAERPALPLLTALQNLFYRLQTSEAVVSCRELMRSFGWDTADAFMQHDAQELNRLLCDRLEEQMKGTAMDGAIKRLFEGEFENYIECVEIDYTSKRDETFYDLQLNVRNDVGRDLTSLEESLRDFISEETLEDENAYDAGSHGKQKARKGIRFKRFPPVLYIQLKRFMFDAERMDMCKLNGRLEFPQILDLEVFAPGSGTYLLHTVVVHSGGVSSGHYYAFVRLRDGENGSDRWVKFDDEQVTLCSEQAAVEDNYGGEDPMVWNYFNLSAQQLSEKPAPTVERIHNAYMLSYVRADQAESILASPNLNDEEAKTYRAMVERCVREARLADERKREKMQQLMRIEVRMLLEREIVTLEGWWTHHDFPYTHTFRMSRDQSGEDLYLEAERLLDVPHTHIALFLLHIRKTRQIRFKFIKPDMALRTHLPAHGAPHSSTADPHFVVLCVISRGYDIQNFEWTASPGSTEVPHEIYRWTDDICMLIVKYFCPTKERLVTLGCYYCHVQEQIEDLTRVDMWLEERLKPFIEKKEVAPFSPSQGQLLCFEEYCFKHPKDILERNMANTIEKEGLYTGDIIILQPAPRYTPSPGAPRQLKEADDEDDSEATPRMRQEKDDAEGTDVLATEGSKPDPEDEGVLISRLKRLFTRCHDARSDDDVVSRLSPQEFAKKCSDPELAALLKDLDIDINDVKGLFQLKNEDSGEVNAEEFVASCLRLRGTAKVTNSRSDGCLPADEDDQFPIYTVKDVVTRSASQVHLTVKLYSPEAPWCPEGVPADGLWGQPLPGSGNEELGELPVGLQTPGVQSMCAEGDRLPGEVDSRDLIADIRWPLGLLVARIVKALGLDAELGQRCLWCFDRGPPSAFDFAPVYRTEAAPLRRRDRFIRDLMPRPFQRHMTFHAVLLPPRLPPPMHRRRPVAVHFFGVDVREVGAHIFHVGELEADGHHPGEEEHESDEDSSMETGRPQVDPVEVLELARRFLEQPENANLCSSLAPPSAAQKLPLLRLVDIERQRIRAVYRPSTSGATSTTASNSPMDSSTSRESERPELWSRKCGCCNFFSNALRVEPDWDCDEEPVLPETTLQGSDGVPRRRRAQMVEVFHCDQRHGQEFGHPFLLRMPAGEKAQHTAERLKAKLKVPEEELSLWRLVLVTNDMRTIMNEQDEWPGVNSQRMLDNSIENDSLEHSRPAWSCSAPAFCIERLHPAHRTRSPVGSAVTRASALRGQKPLMIR